jgi:hypothetical protein
VVLLSSAGVSRRLKDPRSALAGAIIGLLLLFRVEDEEERKLDSAHASQRGKHWVIISQVCKTKKENLWIFPIFESKGSLILL